MITIDLNEQTGSIIIKDIQNYVLSNYLKVYDEISLIVCGYRQYYDFDKKEYKDDNTDMFEEDIYMDINNYHLYDESKINERIYISKISNKILPLFFKESKLSNTDKKFLIESFTRSIENNYALYNSWILDDSIGIESLLLNGMLTTNFFSIDELLSLKIEVFTIYSETIVIDIINKYTSERGFDNIILEFIINNNFIVDSFNSLTENFISQDYIIKNFDYNTITKTFDNVLSESNKYCFAKVYMDYINTNDLNKLEYIRNYIDPNETKSSEYIVSKFNERITDDLLKTKTFTKILNKLNIKTDDVVLYNNLRKLYIK